LRERYGSAGNKDDRFDAYLLADTCAVMDTAGTRCAKTAMQPKAFGERCVDPERTSSRSVSGCQPAPGQLGIGVPRRIGPVLQARQRDHSQLLAAFPDSSESAWLSPKRMEGWPALGRLQRRHRRRVALWSARSGRSRSIGAEGDARGEITLGLVDRGRDLKRADCCR